MIFFLQRPQPLGSARLRVWQSHRDHAYDAASESVFKFQDRGKSESNVTTDSGLVLSDRFKLDQIRDHTGLPLLAHYQFSDASAAAAAQPSRLQT